MNMQDGGGQCEKKKKKSDCIYSSAELQLGFEKDCVREDFPGVIYQRLMGPYTDSEKCH